MGWNTSFSTPVAWGWWHHLDCLPGVGKSRGLCKEGPLLATFNPVIWITYQMAAWVCVFSTCYAAQDTWIYPPQKCWQLMGISRKGGPCSPSWRPSCGQLARTTFLPGSPGPRLFRPPGVSPERICLLFGSPFRYFRLPWLGGGWSRDQGCC